MSNIKPLMLTCPACFGTGVDVTNHDTDETCVLCDGMGIVTALQAQEWRDVCTTIKLGDLPVPRSLKHWEKYIITTLANERTNVTQCPNCQHDISKDNDTCGHCGFSQVDFVLWANDNDTDANTADFGYRCPNCELKSTFEINAEHPCPRCGCIQAEIAKK